MAMTEVPARASDPAARVAVLGQGYVGLVVSMQASEAGFDVVGYEVAQQRASDLKAGHSYIEDVGDAELAAALDRGYLPTSPPRSSRASTSRSSPCRPRWPRGSPICRTSSTRVGSWTST